MSGEARKRTLKSMRARMTVLVALLVALLMIGMVLGIVRLERHRALARSEESLQQALERARHEVFDDTDRTLSLAKRVDKEQGEIAAGGLALFVVRGEKVIWQNQNTIPAWPLKGNDWKFKTLQDGQDTIVIACPWTPDVDELNTTTRELTAIGFIVVFATALISWFVVGNTLSPIVRLAEQAQSSTHEVLSVRLQAPSSDAEISYLTQTLNDLLGRLEKEAHGRAHFYAAASHELRTPIQILLGEIEFARLRARSVEEYQEVLSHVQQGTERLAILVQDLLELNALEMRQNQAPTERINMTFLVERVLTQQEHAAKRRSLTFDSNVTETILEAPTAHIEVLLRNLVENATKYATSGTDIRITLTSIHDQTRFEVFNACILEDDMQLEQWFEPFFRPDASRSSLTGGNGLGLAICRTICNLNQWNISLHPQENGLTVVVLFAKAAGTQQ